MSYNSKFPRFLLSKGTENTTALHILTTKSRCFGAEAKIPRRAGLGEFPFRKISYMRKAVNCLEYEVFAAKQKEIILVPLTAVWNYSPRKPENKLYLSFGSWMNLPS
jgi:hypothetical protein